MMEYITKLKDSINSEASEVARRYSSKKESQGYELLARIFALWTIKKADITEEKGV